jgi:predicted secreted hydrolase
MTLRVLAIAVLCLAAAAAVASQAVVWRQALAGFTFAFPRDHASHPDYKIEWWYYTGNLDTASGRRFGYQVTFFRIGVELEPRIASRWAVRDLFIAHLAVSDLQAGQFHFTDRLNRAGVGQAGAEVERYRVWNETWEVTLDQEGNHRLRAAERGIGVDLVLEPGKPPVVHGRDGISQKGSQPGNATHYYSLTRMPTRGAVTVGGERFEVRGTSWMDHEFGTSFLEREQKGWDWFSVQLADGWDLMLFQLRRADGSRDPRSSGTLVAPDGTTTPIAVEEIDLTPERTWRSPVSGASYPVAWRLRIPTRRIDLRIQPALDGQELVTLESTGVVYWEGATDVTGTREGATVRGRGYLELTGYSGRSIGSLLN